MADLTSIAILKAAIAAVLNNSVPDQSIEPDDHNTLLDDLLDTITGLDKVLRANGNTGGYSLTISDGDLLKLANGAFTGDIDTAVLTGFQTYTFQDATGTIAFLSDIVSPVPTVESTSDSNFAPTSTTPSTLISADTSSNDVTIDLPAAVGKTGFIYSIKKTDAANNLIIDANGAELIDGVITQTLTDLFDWISIQSNGTSWDVVSKVTLPVGTNFSKILYVDPNGDDNTGVKGDVFSPFLTVDGVNGARAAAGPEDLIVLNPGQYIKTVTTTNGFSKEGVNFFYHIGAKVTTSVAGEIHSNSGFASPSKVTGYGEFERTASNSRIYRDSGISGSYFECQSVSSVMAVAPVYTSSIVSAGDGYIHIRGELLSTGGIALETFRTNGTVICGNIRSTASRAVTGNQQNTASNIFITAELIESTASTAILIDRAHITAKKIAGTTYGLDTGGQYNGFVTLSCSDIDSIRVTLAGKVDFTGYARNMTASDGEITGGTTGEILVNGATGKVRTTWVGTGSNKFITISDGEALVDMDTYPSTVGRINQSGGILTLTGQSNNGLSTSTNYGNTSYLSGGVCHLKGVFDVGALNYFMKVNGGTLHLHNSRFNLKGTDITANTCIQYESGMVTSNGAVIVLPNGDYTGVTAANPSLELNVNAAGLSINRNSFPVLLGVTNKIILPVTTAAVATSISLNDQVNPIQNFATGADTKANMAVALVGLINGAGLNVLASQDNAGVDEFFYVESTIKGSEFIETLRVNLGKTVVRNNGYPMTNAAGGTIIENTNVQ